MATGAWRRKINASPPYVGTRRGIQKEWDVLSPARSYCCCAVSLTTIRRLPPTRCEYDATSPRMEYTAGNTPIAAQTLHLAILVFLIFLFMEVFSRVKSFVDDEQWFQTHGPRLGMASVCDVRMWLVYSASPVYNPRTSKLRRKTALKREIVFIPD